jgi:hypothetical protein
LTGTYTKLTLGDDNSIAQPVTVRTGAGNSVVNVQARDGDDDSTDASIDYVYATSLNKGNILNVYGVGIGTLEEAAGENHTIYVDEINVYGASGPSRPGEVVVADAAVIGELNVFEDGVLTVAADGTEIGTLIVEGGGTASFEAETTITSGTLSGTATFTGTSAPSTIDTLTIDNGTLNMNAASNLNIDF